MSDLEKFEIVDGELKKYKGKDTVVVIPKGVTRIGDRAFYWNNLKKITIPDSVMSIGVSAFECCFDLKSITIPDSVTSIGESAFSCCRSLTSIAIPDSVTTIERKTFESCGGLTSVTIPDNVTSIGDYAFRDCCSLTSITIPDGVTSIGFCAFDNCESLTSITILDSVTSIGRFAFSQCRSLTSITIPKCLMSYFIGNEFSKPVGVVIIGDKNRYYAYADQIGVKTNLEYTNDEIICPIGWEDYDLEIINNGPKYKFNSIVRLIGALGRLLDPVELSDFSKEQYAELLNKNIKKLFVFAEERGKSDMVRDMLSLDIWEDKALKTFNKLISDSTVPEIKALSGVQVSNASKSTSSKEVKKSQSDPLQEKYANKLKEVDGNKTLKNMKLLGVSMPEVCLADGTKAPDEIIRFILVSYGSQSGDYKIVPDADEAAKLLSYESLCNAMDSISGHLDGPQYPYVLTMLCRYGNASQIRDLTKAWKSWGNWYSYGAKGRKAQEILQGALILSDTKEAVAWLETHGGLNEYANMRGIGTDEVYAKYLFDFGFDKDGKQVFDLGSTKIEARLTSELKLELYDVEKGKTIKSVPKKNVDLDIQKRVSDEIADIRQNIKKAVKIKNDHLFADYLDGTKVTVDKWKKQYLENPFLNKVAKLLVWSQEKKCFLITDDGLIDCDGKSYSLSDEPIVVAHPKEMKAKEVTAWQKYFASHGLKQPFAQIWEPVFDKDEIKDDRYNDCQIRAVFLKNQEKRGIHCEWHESAYNESKELSIKGFKIEVSDVPKQDDGYYYLSIDYIHPNRWNRRANNVIAFLDRITVLERIRKDDVSIMNLVDKYTLAQVMEFINVAQESGSVNVLAQLLDYKNQKYSDFDPLESFTL